MLDAACRGLGESTRFLYFFRTTPEHFCLLSAVYTYPPLNSSQYYIPPREGNPGDLTCDCNTVMYKYEVSVP